MNQTTSNEATDKERWTRASTERHQDRNRSQDHVRQREPGEPPLLYFAQKADVEGYPDVAALFRSVAEGETGHAFGHFDFLREVGDPVTGTRVGPTEDNLKSAVKGGDLRIHRDVPGLCPHPRPTRASTRSQKWFETLARAEKSHAGRFTEGAARSPDGPPGAQEKEGHRGDRARGGPG